MMTQRKSSDLNAPKLKEQLSSKIRDGSAIPGSFYDRDIAFKSNAYEERRAAVPPRHQGSCQCVLLLGRVCAICTSCLLQSHYH